MVNELLDLANQVSPNPPGRELDMLLTAGERISMALLAMAIRDQGCEAISFTGSQAGILTDTSHGSAKIQEIRAQVGKHHVILGLSGGVDSSVAAVLLHEAIGDLRTFTSGRGQFSMEFSHYAPCPQNVAEQVIEETRERKAAA